MTEEKSTPRTAGRQPLFSDEDRWIQTYTGQQFYPFRPDPAALDIEDIAHALAMKCRFTGHSRLFYSVAQHSVVVSGCENPHLGLMHDAAEAYLPDVASPLKSCYAYHVSMERELLRCILAWCGLIHNPDGVFMLDEQWDAVKTADRRALATERRDLMASHIEWPGLEDVQPYGERIDPWPWMFARKFFLSRFHSLFEADPREGRNGCWRPREVTHG